MCICVLCCVLFFFKQKPAYELRISYWSSDVCSSDLGPDRGLTVPAMLAPRLEDHRDEHVRTGIAGVIVEEQLAVTVVQLRHPLFEHEIGREAGRERVCQDV